jgi:hypothetical protein
MSFYFYEVRLQLTVLINIDFICLFQLTFSEENTFPLDQARNNHDRLVLCIPTQDFTEVSVYISQYSSDAYSEMTKIVFVD